MFWKEIVLLIDLQVQLQDFGKEVELRKEETKRRTFCDWNSRKVREFSKVFVGFDKVSRELLSFYRTSINNFGSETSGLLIPWGSVFVLKLAVLSNRYSTSIQLRIGLIPRKIFFGFLRIGNFCSNLTV